MRLTFDSNILVYAADNRAGQRHAKSVDLLVRAAGADCVLMLQCLAEFYAVTTRKARLSPVLAEGFIGQWLDVFPTQPHSRASLNRATQATREHGLPFWDAMLWASAQQANCSLLISEDLQDGRRLGRVTFVNPFAPANADLLERALS